jgi:hypothetical protein
MLKRLAFVLTCVLAFSPMAGAQESAVGDAVSRAGKFLKLTPDPVEPAPFVKESRPAKLDYIPVHSKRPDPKTPPLTMEQLKAKEAELDRVRASHDQLAQRPSTKAAYKPLAQAPKPKRMQRNKCIGYCLAKGTILPSR